MENEQNNILTRRRLLQFLAISSIGSAALPSQAFADIKSPGDIFDDIKKPIFVPENTGKKGKIGDGDISFKLNKSQTDGHVGITESTLPVGYLGAPPHYHKTFDEICRVTQGVLTIMVGNELFEVKAGDWHLRPRGIVHSFWNTGRETVKFIELYSPAGHEAYMSDLAALFINNQRPKPGDLDRLAKQYDITFDWPWLKEIMDKYQVHL